MAVLASEYLFKSGLANPKASPSVRLVRIELQRAMNRACRSGRNMQVQAMGHAQIRPSVRIVRLGEGPVGGILRALSTPGPPCSGQHRCENSFVQKRPIQIPCQATRKAKPRPDISWTSSLSIIGPLLDRQRHGCCMSQRPGGRGHRHHAGAGWCARIAAPTRAATGLRASAATAGSYPAYAQ